VQSKLTRANSINRTEPTTKKWKNIKKLKKRVCSELSAKSPGIRGVSPEEENEGCGWKDLQKCKGLCLE